MIDTTRTMIIAPHVDDEVWCYGLVKKYKPKSLSVVYGSTHRDLGDTRVLDDILKAEIEHSQKYLKSTIFDLGLYDSYYDGIPLARVIDKFIALLKKHKPTLVLSPYKNDINQDHQVIAKAVEIAMRSYKMLPYGMKEVSWLWYFTPSTTEQSDITFSPDIFIELDSELLMNKIKFFTGFKTGVDITGPRSAEGIMLNAQYYGSMISAKYAEVYQCRRIIL